MLQSFRGNGLDIDEPDWNLLIPNMGKSKSGSNKYWRDYAHVQWLRITTEMRETNTLAPVNGHQIQRLILAYVRYNRASIEVFRGGTIGKAPISETPTLQIYHSEMRQADADATTAERELGITPLRRGNTKQVKRAEQVQRKSDKYLAAAGKPISG